MAIIRLMASTVILPSALVLGILFVLLGWFSWLLTGEGYVSKVEFPDWR